MFQNQKQLATWSCAVGSVISWYDFVIFGTAAALIFKDLFFPGMSHLGPILVFAVGFIGRPLGSVLFGWLGDRIGRKPTLTWTLLLTGIFTVAIGLLPTYESIGIMATALLIVFRILQSAALGGEWSAASTMMLEYNIDSKHRGFFGSLISAGLSLASIMAAAIFALITLLPTEDLMSWGWRVPFLLSAVLVVFGMYLRLKLLDTPAFQDLKRSNSVSISPMKDLFATSWKKILACTGAHQTASAWYFGVTVFGFAWLTNNSVMTRAEISQIWLYFTPVALAAVLFFGWLGDRIGRVTMYQISAVSGIVLAVPMIWALSQGNLVLVLMMGVLLMQAMTWSQAPTFFTEIYPSHIRQSGSGVTLQIPSVIGGGFMPLVYTQVSAQHGIMWVAPILIALGVWAVVSSWWLKALLSKESVEAQT